MATETKWAGIGGCLQVVASVTGSMSIWGWFFWLGTYCSDTSLAALRQDPEFSPMISMSEELSLLAPFALVVGVAAAFWRPRYIGAIAMLLGLVGTIYLALLG
jgi:hypothetical protein